MGVSVLYIDHLEAVMRTEARACTAMPADNRFSCFFVKIDSVDNARSFALPAADAFFFFQVNSTA